MKSINNNHMDSIDMLIEKDFWQDFLEEDLDEGFSTFHRIRWDEIPEWAR